MSGNLVPIDYTELEVPVVPPLFDETSFRDAQVARSNFLSRSVTTRSQCRCRSVALPDFTMPLTTTAMMSSRGIRSCIT